MEYLYHYYEEDRGPLLNLSFLNLEQSNKILKQIKNNVSSLFAAHRFDGYMERRLELEKIIRDKFIKKGGIPETQAPHYFIVSECDWLNTWYIKPKYLKIKITDLNINTISFTYGDMFPTFSERIADGKEYRKQVYSFQEIIEIINKYGLPQEWNPNGEYGPERYIEGQVWSKKIPLTTASSE